MATMPKRVKYRKSQRGRMKGNAMRGNYVAFGEYGLQALETSWVTAKNIEAGRVAATHYLRREGKVFIGGVSEEIAKQALSRVAAKMPIRMRLIRRGHAV
jgi:ribosomal protein L16/L10AE